MPKTIKIDNQTFRLNGDILELERLTVKNDSLKVVWYKACISNGCKLTTMAKAIKWLNN